MDWTPPFLGHLDSFWTQLCQTDGLDGPKEVESRTQGSRPRTQKKSEVKDCPSEDRLSPGQGQECSRPRTKDTAARRVFQKKKRSSKTFLGNLQFIGVARIFDWGGPKPQSTCNDVIKNFQKRNFLWDKDIVGWKIWNRCLLALNQDFAKREGLNQWHKTRWSETAQMRSFYSLLGHAWLQASLFCFSLALAIDAQFEKGWLKR